MIRSSRRNGKAQVHSARPRGHARRHFQLDADELVEDVNPQHAAAVVERAEPGFESEQSVLDQLHHQR